MGIFEIDDYVINDSPYTEGSVWLGFPSGEGMEISKEKFIKWLDLIYEKDF